MKITLSTILFLLVVSTLPAGSQEPGEKTGSGTDRLVVVWTSGDIEVAEKMVFMYVYNAKRAKWFDEVTFIIWGPSARLLAENEKLQSDLRKMQEAGIKTEACIACARMYEVDDELAGLGVDVKGMGTVLSDYLKEGYKILSF